MVERNGKPGLPSLISSFIVILSLAAATQQQTTTSLLSTALSNSCLGPEDVAFNPTNGVLYVACNGYGGILSILDNITTSLDYLDCPNPTKLEYNAGLVIAFCPNEVTTPVATVISINSQGVVRALVNYTQCRTPTAITFNSNISAYVLCQTDNVILEINFKNNQVTTYIGSPYFTKDCIIAGGLYYDSLRNITYVLCLDIDQIWKFSNGTPSALGIGGCSIAMYAFAYNPTTGLTYVACNNQVDIYNCTSTYFIGHYTYPSVVDFYFSVKGEIFLSYNDSVVAINGTESRMLVSGTECLSSSGITSNPTTGAIFVACNSGGVISISNSSVITKLLQPPQCVSPSVVVVDDATGTSYVLCNSNPYSGLNSIISISSGVVATVATSVTCKYPDTIAFNPKTSLLYVECYNGVYSINIDTLEFTKLAIESVNAFAFDSTSNAIYYANYAGVYVMTGTTSTLLASTSVCVSPAWLIFDSVRRILYASCGLNAPDGEGGVIAINVTVASKPNTTVLVSGMETVCSKAQNMVYNSNKQLLYVSCMTGDLSGSVISIATATISANPNITDLVSPFSCVFPSYLDYNPASGDVYVLCSGDVMSIVQEGDYSTLALSTDCQNPIGLAVDQQRSLLYVTCSSSNQVIVIQIPSPPSAAPTGPPSSPPSAAPTGPPSSPPSAAPTGPPSSPPSAAPTGPPSSPPPAAPTRPPSSSPSAAPTGSPSSPPSAAPTNGTSPIKPSTGSPSSTSPPSFLHQTELLHLFFVLFSQYFIKVFF